MTWAKFSGPAPGRASRSSLETTLPSGLSCTGTVLLTSKWVRQTWCTSHLPVPGKLRPDRWIDPEASFGTVMTAS